MQAGTRFTYPGGMEGWVDLDTRKRSRRESNSRPLGLESNALTTEPPSNINISSYQQTKTNVVKSLWLAIISDVCLQAQFEVITADDEPCTELFFVHIRVLSTANNCTVSRVLNASRSRLLPTAQTRRLVHESVCWRGLALTNRLCLINAGGFRQQHRYNVSK